MCLTYHCQAALFHIVRQSLLEERKILPLLFQSCFKELFEETQAIQACVSLITATLLCFILFLSYCWKRGIFDHLQCFFFQSGFEDLFEGTQAT